MDLMDKFEKNVKLMLEEKGISQAEFSRRLNVGKSTVNSWLKVHKEPTLSNICKILEELKCDFKDLVD